LRHKASFVGLHGGIQNFHKVVFSCGRLRKYWLKYVKLSGGSGFARGFALGKVIKDVCIHSLSFFEQRLVEEGLTLEYGLALALENEKVMAKHFPELLEEIRGVAEGAQMPYNSLLLETAYPFAAGASSNCTVISAFGSATRDRAPIVGRNYDFLLDFKKCNQLRSITGKNAGFSFVGGTITILGVEEGMNDAGLFIGDAGWEPKELPSSRGLSSRQVMQLVLENCISVDTAIDFIRQTPKFANNAGNCYLLADKRETIAMEMGLTKICLRMPEEDMQVVSNTFLTSIAEEIEPPEPTAVTRYNLVRKRLHENRGEVNNTFMRKLLSDHSIPVCAHNEINTLRSIIAKTNEKKMMVAEGHPCASKFEEISITT
jgi:isopenicillin-N N-acyltransferase-like protein